MSDYLDDQEQERSDQDIASAIGSSVLPQILNIVNTLRPELVHVFTHANDNPRGESKKGIFQTRHGYFSALSRQSGMNINLNLNINLNINLNVSLNINLNLDPNLNLNQGVKSEFKIFVVSVESPRGVTAFMVEGFLTKELNSNFPYIKRVDLTVDTWSTVMANSKVGAGKRFPDTLCYVSFGYGLKQSLAQGSIVQNPVGRVAPDEPEAKAQRLAEKHDKAHRLRQEVDQRLALLLFNNRIFFSKSALFRKSDLRKSEFYRDILQLKCSPGNDKTTTIFALYTKLVVEANEGL